jgi:HK97 family phage major capsid protein
MTTRHRQLLAQRAELEAKQKILAQQGRALADTCEQEKRLPSPEEKIQRDGILAQLDEVRGQIDAVNGEITAEIALEGHETAQIAQLTMPSAGNGAAATVAYVRPAFRDEFKGLGEFLQAMAAASSPIMAQSIPRSDALLAKLAYYQSQYQAALATGGMSVGSPQDGGFLVRTTWTNEILNKAQEQAVLLPLCREVQIGGDSDSLEYPYIDETSRATGSRWGGVRLYYAAEADAGTATKPKINKGELELLEIVGMAYATNRLLRDATALGNILGDAFASELAFKVDNDIIRGTGGGQIKGFFDTGAACVSVAKEGSQVAATVVAANVLKMYARIPPRMKMGVVWLIHPDVMSQLPLMAIGQQPVWLPPGGLTNEPNGRLLGKPVYEIEQAEALGTQGDIFCLVPREYLVITKQNEGLQFDTSMHLRFDTREMAFRWVFRINGQPIWKQSVTPFKGGANWSPYVTLDTRA